MYRLGTLYKHLLPCSILPSLPQQVVWKLDVPTKLKVFCWRLLLDRLPTRLRLSRWTSTMDPIYPLCTQANETLNHVFASCPFAQSVWALFPISIQKPFTQIDIEIQFWNISSHDLCRLWLVVFWYLWKNRNNYIFQYHPVNPFHVFAKATNAILEWNLSCLYTSLGSTHSSRFTRLVVTTTSEVAKIEF